jgi:hypothetical protein
MTGQPPQVLFPGLAAASPPVLVSFALLGLFALVPVFYTRWKGRAKGGNQ